MTMPDTIPTYRKWRKNLSPMIKVEVGMHSRADAMLFCYTACRDLALPAIKERDDEIWSLKRKNRLLIDTIENGPQQAEIEQLEKRISRALAILNDEQLINRINSTDGLMIATGRIGQYDGPTLEDARAALAENNK